MKRIYRSDDDKKLGGLCGGFGEYFDIDPTLVRLGTIVVCLLTAVFPVAVCYLIGWIIVPQKHELGDTDKQSSPE